MEGRCEAWLITHAYKYRRIARGFMSSHHGASRYSRDLASPSVWALLPRRSMGSNGTNAMTGRAGTWARAQNYCWANEARHGVLRAGSPLAHYQRQRARTQMAGGR